MLDASSARSAVPLPSGCRIDLPQRKPRAALCLSGHLRTFARPHVHASIAANLVGSLDANSDIFVALRDGDAPTRRQRGWSFSPVTADKAAVSAAVAALQPRFVWHARADAVAWLQPSAGCKMKNGSWMATYTSRVLGQLSLWAECHHAMLRAEAEDGKPYEWVVRTRPDAYWYAPHPRLCSLAPHIVAQNTGHNMGFVDQHFVLPRAAAEPVMLGMAAQFRACNGSWPYSDLEHWLLDSLTASAARIGALVKRVRFPVAIVRNDSLEPSAQRFCENPGHNISTADCMRLVYAPTPSRPSRVMATIAGSASATAATDADTAATAAKPATPEAISGSAKGSDQGGAPSAPCHCFSTCSLEEAQRFLAILPPRLTAATSPWVAYLKVVYDGHVTLPFDTHQLRFFYHNDAAWRRKHPGVEWPMASCRWRGAVSSLPAVAPSMPDAYHFPVANWSNRIKGPNKNATFAVVGQACAPVSCTRWRSDGGGTSAAADEDGTSGASTVPPPLPSRTRAVLHGFVLPNSDGTTRGSLLYGQKTSWLADGDGSWTEVMRFAAPVLPAVGMTEGMHDVGCWFFPAVGSGIYVNVGRSFVADVETDVYGAQNTFKKAFDAWAGAHPAAAAPVLERHPFRISRGRFHREVFPAQAAVMGLDSIQIGEDVPGKRWAPLRGSAAHAQMVLTTPACMHGSTPLGACPRTKLRLGWNASRPCTCINAGEWVLNCAG